jgi:hypothetical protein
MGTRAEKVTTGQKIRTPHSDTYRTVASHGTGYLRGIHIAFTDGSSVTTTPGTLVNVAA